MKCEICGREISGSSAFTCNYCKGTFCPEHRLPFNHACKNLAGWKQSGAPGKKRFTLSKKPVLSSGVPLYKKKEVIIGGAVIIILAIIAFIFIFLYRQFF